MRSNISTPFRWSSSCWNSRPASSLGLDLDRVAVEVETPHEHLVRAQHLDVQTGDAEAALVVDPLAAALDDLGVDDRPSARRRCPRRRSASARRSAVPPGRCRSRSSYSVSNMSSTSRAILPSMSVTAAALVFSTGSPKVRIEYAMRARLPTEMAHYFDEDPDASSCDPRGRVLVAAGRAADPDHRSRRVRPRRGRQRARSCS